MLTPDGRSTEHRYASWSTSNRRADLPTDWPNIRKRVMLRDRYLCYVCGNAARDVDHIDDPHDHTDANLAAVCAPCHDNKTLAEAAEGRRRAYL